MFHVLNLKISFKAFHWIVYVDSVVEIAELGSKIIYVFIEKCNFVHKLISFE